MRTFERRTELRLIQVGLLSGIAGAVVLDWIPAAAQQLEEPELVDPATQNTAQLQMAEAIDRVCPLLDGTGGDREAILKRTCGSLVNNTQDQDQAGINSSVQTINGEELNSLTSEVVEVRGVQVANISSRLAAIRAGLTGPGLSFVGLDVEVGGDKYALDDLADHEIIPAQATEGGIWDKLGVFVTGGFKFGSKDSTGTVDGFDFNTSGVTIGADYRLSNTFVLGAAFGYSNYDVDFEASAVSPEGQKLDSDNILFSLFTTYYPVENFFIDGIASVGGSFYDSTRRVVVPSNTAVPSIDTTATGSFDAIPFGFSGNVGYELSMGPATVTPIGRLEYLAASVGGFSEDPVQGAVELKYDSQYIDSLTFNLGLLVDYAISTDYGVFVPTARGELVNQFLTDPDGVKIQYVNDPTGASAFTAVPDEIDSTYGIFGVGLTGQFAGGWSAFVDYTAVAGLETFNIQSVNFGLRKSF